MRPKSTDQRGPLRTITAVEWPTRDGGTYVRVTLDCGHIREPASHFTYRVGDTFHCFTCLSLPE
jgi:hypothetical protein